MLAGLLAAAMELMHNSLQSWDNLVFSIRKHSFLECINNVDPGTRRCDNHYQIVKTTYAMAANTEPLEVYNVTKSTVCSVHIQI